MSKLDNPAYLADRLMMGPNGTVCHLDGLSAATNTEQSPRLVGNGGQGSACFRYSAEAPRRDGGQAGGSFRFSAETPHRDGGNGSICCPY